MTFIPRTAAVALAFLFAPALAAQTNCEIGAATLRIEQPETLSVREIIGRLAANESIFKAARKNYSYTLDVRIQTLWPTTPGQFVADGEFRQIMDVAHDERGRRIEHVTFAPQSTLRRMTMTPTDLEDIRKWSTFELTTEELPQYTIHYSGRQQVDELDTYVFEVAPKVMEKGKRYFQGRLWVEKSDLAVVKTCGKSVPDVYATKKKRIIEDIHPTFAAYREFIDGKYWFPTYSRSDDILSFRAGELRVREIIKFSEYRPAGPNSRPIPGRTLTPKPD